MMYIAHVHVHVFAVHVLNVHVDIQLYDECTVYIVQCTCSVFKIFGNFRKCQVVYSKYSDISDNVK